MLSLFHLSLLQVKKDNKKVSEVAEASSRDVVFESSTSLFSSSLSLLQ